MNKSLATPKIVKPASATDIALVWVALSGLYGDSFTSKFGADPRTGAGSLWANTLAGLTTEQIVKGCDAVKFRMGAWPPGAPEFRAICLGIPSLAAVRLLNEARIRPFARLVWSLLDIHRYRQASAEYADRLLADAYNAACEHVMRGGELPAADDPQIEHEEPEPYRQPDEAHMAAVIALAREEAMGDSTA